VNDSKEKPFSCSYCGDTYEACSHWEANERTRIGNTPSCDLCGGLHGSDHDCEACKDTQPKEYIDLTPVGCQTPEDERIRRAIEIIDRANSRVASLATEMVETLARNEQYPSEKLDAQGRYLKCDHIVVPGTVCNCYGSQHQGELFTFLFTANLFAELGVI
jgi:hypothetical protein